jgi:hypothetical protein
MLEEGSNIFLDKKVTNGAFSMAVSDVAIEEGNNFSPI